MSVSAPTRHISDSCGTSPELLLFQVFTRSVHLTFLPTMAYFEDPTAVFIMTCSTDPIQFLTVTICYNSNSSHSCSLQTCYNLVAIGSGHVKLLNQPLPRSAPQHIRLSNRFQPSCIVWPHRSDQRRRVLSVRVGTTWSSRYFYGSNQTTSSCIF